MKQNDLSNLNSDLELVKSLLLEDLKNFYKEIADFDLESTTNFMVLLKYSKEKNYFDNDFIDYWFIKILNNSNHFDLFILEKDNYEFFGYTAKSLSCFIESHCSFLKIKSSEERAVSIIKKALENDCFFENEYLNQFNESSYLEGDFDIFMKKNIANFNTYLNSQFENNNFIKENKVKI